MSHTSSNRARKIQQAIIGLLLISLFLLMGMIEYYPKKVKREYLNRKQYVSNSDIEKFIHAGFVLGQMKAISGTFLVERNYSTKKQCYNWIGNYSNSPWKHQHFDESDICMILKKFKDNNLTPKDSLSLDAFTNDFPLTFYYGKP